MTVPKKLTKQHYEFIIQIIELFKPDVRLGYELGVKWGYNVEKIADEIKKVNSNFNWDEFIDACWSHRKESLKPISSEKFITEKFLPEKVQL